MAHKRQNINRQIKTGVRGETASMVIGDLYPGCEIYGFTKGQFSCIDVLEHVLAQAGPSDVIICTWSAASGDIRAAHRMLKIGGIKTLRFIVDFSFKSRKPEFCQELLSTFGADSVRVTSIHAKFMAVRSEKFKIVIRTSMNLKFNPRFENFEISDDPAMLDFMEGIVSEIWATQERHDGFLSPSKGKQSFGLSFSDGPEIEAVNFLEGGAADLL